MTDINKILDECLDQLNRGQSVDECLAGYPEYRNELKPLLDAAAGTGQAYAFSPDAGRKEAARRRFETARVKAAQQREEKRRLPFPFSFPRLALAAAATLTIALLALAGYTALKPQIEPPVTMVQADPQGNMIFLISDEVNAIADFTSLYVNIERVGLRSAGGWTEFEPEVKEIDLTLLPGEVTQAVWRGDVPPRDYSRITIYVTQVRGVLKASGEMIIIKLPGNKLHLDMDFEVKADSLTSFVYDMTVISTGSPKNPRYQLKPQAEESGASHQPAQNQGQDNNNEDKGQEQEPGQSPGQSENASGQEQNQGQGQGTSRGEQSQNNESDSGNGSSNGPDAGNGWESQNNSASNGESGQGQSQVPQNEPNSSQGTDSMQAPLQQMTGIAAEGEKSPRI